MEVAVQCKHHYTLFHFDYVHAGKLLLTHFLQQNAKQGYQFYN